MINAPRAQGFPGEGTSVANSLGQRLALRIKSVTSSFFLKIEIKILRAVSLQRRLNIITEPMRQRRICQIIAKIKDFLVKSPRCRLTCSRDARSVQMHSYVTVST